MSVRSAAHAFYRLLRSLAEAASRDASTAWSQLDPADLSGSWASNSVADQLLTTVSRSQLAAAQRAEPFVAAAMAEQGATAATAARIQPRALAGVASDGRDLDDLLQQPLLRAGAAIRTGAPPDRALRLGAAALDVIVATQVSDAGRAAVDVAMTATPSATGWVRMLVPPACGRCAVLAGRVYRWSSGFARHPRCNCVHVPAVESVAEDLTVDPDAYFRSLSSADQDRHFGTAAARAIRDGADIGQVVNASRGASGLSQPGRLTMAEQDMLRRGRRRARLQRVDVYGRSLAVTTEGTTRRGRAGARLIAEGGSTRRRGAAGPRRSRIPRLMPAAIAEIAADDRDQRIQLLRRFGYLID